MSLEESDAYRAQHPDAALPTRFVEKLKQQDDSSWRAKSRIIIVGLNGLHQDQLAKVPPSLRNC